MQAGMNELLKSVEALTSHTDLKIRSDARELLSAIELDNELMRISPSSLGYKDRQPTPEAALEFDNWARQELSRDPLLGQSPPSNTALWDSNDLTLGGSRWGMGTQRDPLEWMSEEQILEGTGSIKRDRIRELEREYGMGQKMTRETKSGGYLWGAMDWGSEVTGANPITKVATRPKKTSGWFSSGPTPPDDAFLLSEEFAGYPVLEGLEDHWEAAQILDTSNPVHEDEEGRYINVTSLGGETRRIAVPEQYESFGTEVLEDITAAKMGIDPHMEFGPGRFAAHATSTNTILGSLFHYAADALGQEEEGFDYNVPWFYGTLPFVPNLTGNKHQDLETIQNNPIAARMVMEADSKGTLGLVAGQTVAGMADFLAVNAATGGVGGVAVKGAQLAKINRLAGPMGRFAGRILGGGTQAVSGIARTGSTLGKTARGGSTSGLNFGTGLQFGQEVYYGGMRGTFALAPGTGTVSGLREGFQEGTVELGLGIVGAPFLGSGLLGQISTAARRRWIPESGLDRARHMLGSLEAGEGLAATASLRGLAARSGVREFDTPEAMTEWARKVTSLGGILPSDSTTLRREVESLIKSSALRSEVYEVANVAWIGLASGAFFRTQAEFEAEGKTLTGDWDEFVTRAFANLGSAEAVGSSLGMVSWSGAHVAGSRVPLFKNQRVHLNGEKMTEEQAADRVTRAVLNALDSNSTREKLDLFLRKNLPDLDQVSREARVDEALEGVGPVEGALPTRSLNLQQFLEDDLSYRPPDDSELAAFLEWRKLPEVDTVLRQQAEKRGDVHQEGAPPRSLRDQVLLEVDAAQRGEEVAPPVERYNHEDFLAWRKSGGFSQYVEKIQAPGGEGQAQGPGWGIDPGDEAVGPNGEPARFLHLNLRLPDLINLERGLTRQDSDYVLCVGEQLALKWATEDQAPEVVTEALSQVSSAELVVLWRQLANVPLPGRAGVYPEGYRGATQASASKVQGAIDFILNQRREGVEGPARDLSFSSPGTTSQAVGPDGKPLPGRILDDSRAQDNNWDSTVEVTEDPAGSRLGTRQLEQDQEEILMLLKRSTRKGDLHRADLEPIQKDRAEVEDMLATLRKEHAVLQRQQKAGDDAGKPDAELGEAIADAEERIAKREDQARYLDDEIKDLGPAPEVSPAVRKRQKQLLDRLKEVRASLRVARAGRAGKPFLVRDGRGRILGRHDTAEKAEKHASDILKGRTGTTKPKTPKSAEEKRESLSAPTSEVNFVPFGTILEDVPRGTTATDTEEEAGAVEQAQEVVPDPAEDSSPEHVLAWVKSLPPVPVGVNERPTRRHHLETIENTLTAAQLAGALELAGAHAPKKVSKHRYAEILTKRLDQDDTIALAERMLDDPVGLGLVDPAEVQGPAISPEALQLLRDMQDEQVAQEAESTRVYEEMSLREAIRGIGYRSLEEARAAHAAGELGGDAGPPVPQWLQEVIEGTARVLSLAEVGAAVQEVRETAPNLAARILEDDPDLAAVSAWIGQAERLNSNSLSDALSRLRRAAELEPRATAPLNTADDRALHVELVDNARQEAQEDGDAEAAESLKALDEDQALTEEATVEAAAQTAETGAGPDIVAPFYSGDLFDPTSESESAAFQVGMAMLGVEEGGGTRTSDPKRRMANAIALFAAMANKPQREAEHRALLNGMVMSTWGDKRLLGLVDTIAGLQAGESMASWKALVDSLAETQGERVKGVIAEFRVEYPDLWGEHTAGLKDLLSAGPWPAFLVAGSGVPLRLPSGDKGHVSRDNLSILASDLLGEEGSTDAEQLETARSYILKRGFSVAEGDDLNQEAAFWVSTAQQLRRFAKEGKWTEAGKQGEGPNIRPINLRGKIEQHIARAATGKRGRVAITKEYAQLNGKTPKDVAEELMELLSGAQVDSPKSATTEKAATGEVEKPVKLTDARVGEWADGPGQGLEGSTALLEFARLMEGTIEGVDGIPLIQSVAHLMAAGSKIKAAWSALSGLRHATPGTKAFDTPLVPDGADPSGAIGTNLLSALADEAHPHHQAVQGIFLQNDPKNGQANWEAARNAAQQARTALRSAVQAATSHMPTVLVEGREMTPFDVAARLLELRSGDNAYGPVGALKMDRNQAEPYQAWGLLTENQHDGEVFYTLNLPALHALAEDAMGSVADSLNAFGETERGAELLEARREWGKDRQGTALLFGGLPNPFTFLMGIVSKRHRMESRRREEAARGRMSARLGTWTDKRLPKLKKGGLGLANLYTSNLAGPTQAGIRGPETLKRTKGRKRSLARERFNRAQLRTQAETLLERILVQLTPQDRSVFVDLIDSGTWAQIKNPKHLAQALGRGNAEAMYLSLLDYQEGILELGRQGLLSGMLDQETFDAMKVNTPHGIRTKYIMRAYEPRTDGVAHRQEQLNPSGKNVFAAIGREMRREVQSDQARADQILDPILLISRQYGQETNRNALLRTLIDAADEWGVPAEDFGRDVAPWEIGQYGALALGPEAEVDPFSGRKVTDEQRALYEVLNGMNEAMEAGDIKETPAKRRMIDRLLPKDGVGGVAVDRQGLRALRVLLNETAAVSTNEPGKAFFGDQVWDFFHSAYGWWRRGRTVLKPKHIVMSSVGSIFSNEFAGTAGILEFIQGITTGTGPYANSARAIEDYFAYVADDRSWNLGDLGDRGRNIAYFEKLMERMGGASLVQNIIDRSDPGLFRVFTDPQAQGRMDDITKGAIQSELWTSIGRHMTGMRLSVESLDRGVSKLLGSTGAGADAKVEALSRMTGLYQLHEAFYKMSALLSLADSHQIESDADFDLLLDDAVAATGDYSEVPPLIQELTSNLRRDEVRLAFSGGKEAHREIREMAVLAAKLAAGVPFLTYNFVILPTMTRAMNPVTRGGRAVRPLVASAVFTQGLRWMLEWMFEDEIEVLESSGGTEAMPSLDMSRDVEGRLWRQEHGDMLPGVIGAVDSAGVQSRDRDRRRKELLNLIFSGQITTVAGPSGLGRSTVIDFTPFLAGTPAEYGMKAARSMTSIWDKDLGRTRNEGLSGFVSGLYRDFEFVKRSFIPRQGRTNMEELTQGVSDFFRSNLSSELNPMTFWFSSTAVQAFEASQGQAPTRDMLRGIYRPEYAHSPMGGRLAQALWTSVLPISEVSATRTVDLRNLTTAEEVLQNWVGARYGSDMAGAPQEERFAAVGRKNSQQQVRDLVHGVYSIHLRGRSGGNTFIQELDSRVDAFRADLEQDPKLRGDFQRLKSKPANERSLLGRFVAGQEEGVRTYAIQGVFRELGLAYESHSLRALASLMDRRAVDAPLAMRMWDAITHDKGLNMMHLINKEIDNSKALPAFYQVWVGGYGLAAEGMARTNPEKVTWKKIDNLMKEIGGEHAQLSSGDYEAMLIETFGTRLFELLPNEALHMMGNQPGGQSAAPQSATQPGEFR